MKSVPVNELIIQFQAMYREHWAYDWSGHEKGLVGCAGAFVYAFGQYGITYPNGSNAIARKKIVGNMLPICQAQPGMAAFKMKSPGEDGYKLPDKYKIGGSDYSGNVNDFYHIGLVDEDPAYVLNAKGTKQGFCRDALTAANGWDCVALLKSVDYGKDSGQMNELTGDWAKVVLPAGAKGNTVRMRKDHSTAADVLEKVPVGSEILVTKDDGQWCEIQYNGETGWMMSNYIEYTHQEDETDAITPEQQQQISAWLSVIETHLKAIDDVVEEIGTVVGRG